MNKNSTAPQLKPAPVDEKPNTSKRTILIAFGGILLVLVCLGVFAGIQKGGRQSDQAQIIESKGQKVDVSTENIETITETLPNGKTATYANTESNRNIIFAISDIGDEYVALSHRAIAGFISAADRDVVTKLCGTDGELADKDDIVIGSMSTSVRMIQYPSDNNCLDELATLRNSDPKSRSKAVELVDQVEADVKQFYATVIIK